MSDSNNNSGVAAVDRALSILNAFHKSKSDALTLASIAAHTGFYKSTILRLVSSLEQFGYIRQIHDGKYKLGPTLSALGQLYLDSFQLSEVIEPTLEKIASITEESASLYVRDGSYQVIKFRRDTNNRVRDYLKIGDTTLLSEGGASAKALTYYENYSGEILDPNSYCSYSFGERNPEVAGVAAPVLDHQNKIIGCIVVTGPLFRFTGQKVKEIAATLTKMTIELSLQLGASPSIFELFELEKTN
jgi:DNA-binding IclR family transcriptional regulator